MSTVTSASPSTRGARALLDYHHAVPRAANTLASESSPYLLQHAHNPVNWMPWGEAAFSAARAADKPIFLSVGYSTCYWCHVMERESFENESTAAILNEHFVPIKVDREERPDVDDVYMLATQLVSGSGGWPMSVFLEPRSLKPFYAGTYFPPEDRYGRPGFPSLLMNIARAWRHQRPDVDAQADSIARTIIEIQQRPHVSVTLGASHVRAAIDALMASYDPVHGGFGGGPGGRRAPKFPTPVNLDFLIATAWDQPAVRKAVLYTLDRMALGGMFDQIGGGFHRYSTDEKWLVPHFEKMLYDNGQLLATYADVFARTNDPFFMRILRQTADYVLREMADSNSGGAFWSAQDAEVDHREGLNYLWRPDEIRAALPADDAALALAVYHLDRGPSFVDPHHPEDGGRNVLFLAERPAAIAARLSLSLDDFIQRLDRLNAALLAARSTRKQPGTDDKILTGWNGLMIAGLADAGRALNEPRYIDAARQAADAVMKLMQAPDRGLLRSARSGRAHIPAFLEDYACLIHGLLSLHRATGHAAHVSTAAELTRITRDRFRDEHRGGWYDTLPDQSDLFVRMKSTHDGALPSGNGMMLRNLLELYDVTGDDDVLDDAALALRSLGSTIAEHPTGSIVAVGSLHRLLIRHPERLAGSPTRGDRMPTTTSPDPVRIIVTPSSVRIADLPVEIAITLNIANGFHVNAHEPGIDDLVPLNVQLLGGDGLQCEVRYPPALRLGPSPGESPMVLTGEVLVHVTLTRVGQPRNQPRLVITWQACTDTHCLAPVTHEVPARIIIN